MKNASLKVYHNKAINKTDGSTPYNVLAHLKKISALLSVHDALRMSPELRNSLIYVLKVVEEFSKNDKIAKASWRTVTQESLCIPMVTFEDNNRYSNDPYHNRPLFITSNINDQAISRVMIDGGSAVNIAHKDTGTT